MFQDMLGKSRMKINFHTHTTVSDGKKTPEEAATLYKAAGYDAIALTDQREATRVCACFRAQSTIPISATAERACTIFLPSAVRAIPRSAEKKSSLRRRSWKESLPQAAHPCWHIPHGR